VPWKNFVWGAVWEDFALYFQSMVAKGYREVIGSKPQWGSLVCFTLPLAHT
jgi:hypothetical protein